VSTTNGYGHRGKGDRPGVPPGQQQGHRGRILSRSPNPWEGMMEMRIKTKRRVGNSSAPFSAT
jgi:hypothetical protein